MGRYKKYKNENVGLYVKKKYKNEDVEQDIIGKLSWLRIEMEDYNVNTKEFVDSYVEGDYHNLKALIELVKREEVKAVLVWDFRDIPISIVNEIVNECISRNIYINGFLSRVSVNQ